jgi:hypothetical protein
MSARYLNVDCILKSDHSLEDLRNFLKNDVFVLWDELSEEGNSFGFETNLFNTNAPEEDISEFLRLFDLLPLSLLQLLNGCREKIFDIGFESDTFGYAANAHLSAAVISKLGQLGFSIGIRIYSIAIQGAEGEIGQTETG